MHITLLRPPTVTAAATLTAATGSPPIGCAYLSAFLKREGYEVTVIDALGEAMDQFTRIGRTSFYANGLRIGEVLARIPEHTDFIGVSCMFSNDWLFHRRILNAIAESRPEVPLFVGGEHASAVPEYVLRSCPGVRGCAVGEGEETMLELLETLQVGGGLREVASLVLRGDEPDTFITTPKRERKRHLDDLPWPDWDAVPLAQYLDRAVGHGTSRGRNMPMMASRGCPYRCTFCSNPRMWGKLWNVRTPQDVVDEMEHYIAKYNIDSFSFFDLTAIVQRKWILQFTGLLKARNMQTRWLLPTGTRSEALDEEVLRALRETGCLSITYAPESGSVETLERVKKQVNLDKMLLSMRACSRAGIFSKANIVMAFPGDTRRDIWKTYAFIWKMAWAGVHDVTCFAFSPYPGSVLFYQLQQEGKFPEEGEAFDIFLASQIYNDYSRVMSWSEAIPPGELRWHLIGGMLFFYIAQFTIRPWRAFESLYRLFTSNPMTMSERLLDNMPRRIMKMLRTSRSMGRHTAG